MTNAPICQLLAVLSLALLGCGGSQDGEPSTPPATASPAGGTGSAAAEQADTGSSASASAGEGAAAGETANAGQSTEASADGEGGEVRSFKELDSKTAGDARGVKPSAIEPTATEAALKFFVIDKDKGAIPGIVIALTSPSGKKFYTEETDAKGYAEVLVPVGQTYQVVYLSLGRQKIAAKVPVNDKPRQNIKLTLRYKRYDEEMDPNAPKGPRPFVLDGIEFDTGKATLRPESRVRLEQVVEYLSHKKSARIEISGHTDNVGNPRANKALSKKRAEACRQYLLSKGIAPDRVEAVGHGADKPIASNKTPEGRQKNRRIEAREI